MKRNLGRPPSFPSLATLAAELDVPESKILKLVADGILPKPLNLDPRLQRWDWEQCRNALSTKAGGAALTEDPYIAGARNATATR